MPAVAEDVRGQVRRHRDSLPTEVVRKTRMRIDRTCFSDWALSMCTCASNVLAVERKNAVEPFYRVRLFDTDRPSVPAPTTGGLRQPGLGSFIALLAPALLWNNEELFDRHPPGRELLLKCGIFEGLYRWEILLYPER
jgi:hypothetical protein